MLGTALVNSEQDISYVSKQEVFLDQFLCDHVNYWENSIFPNCFYVFS